MWENSKRVTEFFEPWKCEAYNNGLLNQDNEFKNVQEKEKYFKDATLNRPKAFIEDFEKL
jgi:hypothetical protein